jgi:hypothetical protein
MSIQEGRRISPRLQTPQRTEDIRADIGTWLGMGNCVVLYKGEMVEHVYHRCVRRDTTELKQKPDLEEQEYKVFSLETMRVIYIDTEASPLFDVDQWSEYVKKNGYSSCRCIIKHQVRDCSKPVYKYAFKAKT